MTSFTDRGEWHGCYDAGWRALIVPEAFAHPAKMARGLLVRIFDELFAMGALQKGDLVVDPFAGIGTTGIEAASRGLRFVGCELEPKFVALAQQNFEWHARDWYAMARPQPVILQGDSRKLREVLREAACVVTSPPHGPYGLGHGGGTSHIPHDTSGTMQAMRGGYGGTPGQLGELPEGSVDAVVGSPPFTQGYSSGGGINVKGYGPDGGDKVGSRTYQGTGADRADGNLETMPLGSVDAVVASPPYAIETVNDRNGIDRSKFAPGVRPGGPHAQGIAGGYGSTDGQLGAMAAGEVAAVIASPPYAEIAAGAGGLNTKPAKDGTQQSGRHAASASQATDQHYGESDGQLARLPAGEVDAVVSSPPYEGNTKSDRLMGDEGLRAREERRGFTQGRGCFRSSESAYGAGDGQLGQAPADTFWSAAKQVVEECHAILRPGGLAVFVTKDFVRDKKRVAFSADWLRLCEACGFTLVKWVHASLVAEERTPHLWNGETVTRRERKSFFRRLAEKKGSPRIDHEDVLFLVRMP